MFLQLILCAVIGVYGVKGQTSFGCSTEQETKIQACINSSADFSNIDFTQLLNFVDTPIYGFCSKKTEFKSVMNCVYNVYRTCLGSLFTSLQPTNEMNQKTIDYFCSKLTYNVSCVENYIRNGKTCRLQGLDSISEIPTYENGKAYACGLRKNGKLCSDNSTELNKCPETKKIYQELIKLRNPEPCGGEAGFESGVFDDGKSAATPLYLSVILLTTIILMKFIF